MLKKQKCQDSSKKVFKRPLWLAVLGDRRHEVSLLDAYTGYCSRYDIEHYFRFAKNNLLADDYQTPDVDHEESWWKLCALAYNQLNQANTLTTSTPYPWEQYLPAFKDAESEEISTPSQTQRGFQKLLDKVGTPAKGPTKRGTAPGREPGTEVAKRTKHPVIFKKSKAQAKPKDNNPSSERSPKNSEPETIENLAQRILKELDSLNYSPHDLVKLIESA